MNGRTCQLCGKALSRFGVGSGGDFCSREHRNQFRLRLGMDRLQEANKVASLMRRRENAKAIPAGLLARDCKVAPRSAPHLTAPVRATAIYTLLPQAAELGNMRVTAHAGHRLSVKLWQAPERRAVSLDSPSPFTLAVTRPSLPARNTNFPVQISPAGPAAFRRARESAKEGPRQMAALDLGTAHRQTGASELQLRPPSRCYHEPQAARRLIATADRGRQLRVSGGVGFRLPPARIRPVPFAVPRTAPLVRTTEPRILMTVCKPPAAEVRSDSIPPFEPGIFAPRPTRHNPVVQFPWPSAILVGNREPLSAASAARSCQTKWQPLPPLQPRPDLRNGATHLPPSAGLRFFPAAEPLGKTAVRRLTQVAFQPQDTPFEYSSTAIHGTLVGGMQVRSSSGSKAEPQPTTLQEHFAGGWDNWLGGTDDWKVDAAGVRTGSLALFIPSMECADYDLEFLARIESRSVNWLFRATGFQDYYQATLAALPTGGYELRRHAVINGKADVAIARPVALAAGTPAGRTAVTVRTSITGNIFSISLDSQVIDTWTDTRLTTGGIGFVSAPDDRARLYWVKVTPADHLSKEHRKQ